MGRKTTMGRRPKTSFVVVIVRVSSGLDLMCAGISVVFLVGILF